MCIRDSNNELRNILARNPSDLKEDGSFDLLDVSGLGICQKDSFVVSVVATIKIKPGTREQFLEHFLKLVPEVLQEDGCIEYFPAVDAETGIGAQQQDADAVVVLEKWESVDALKKHLAAEHMEKFREVSAELVTDLSIKVLSPAK